MGCTVSGANFGSLCQGSGVEGHIVGVVFSLEQFSFTKAEIKDISNWITKIQAVGGARLYALSTTDTQEIGDAEKTTYTNTLGKSTTLRTTAPLITIGIDKPTDYQVRQFQKWNDVPYVYANFITSDGRILGATKDDAATQEGVKTSLESNHMFGKPEAPSNVGFALQIENYKAYVNRMCSYKPDFEPTADLIPLVDVQVIGDASSDVNAIVAEVRTIDNAGNPNSNGRSVSGFVDALDWVVTDSLGATHAPTSVVYSASTEKYTLTYGTPLTGGEFTVALADTSALAARVTGFECVKTATLTLA